MLKKLSFLFVGLFFGVVMTKSEAISWLRIYEMFRFGSFHMYGIIGSAVVLGVLGNVLARKFKLRTIEGVPYKIKDKAPSIARYLIGGSLFGLGWAMTGACPGPMYVLVGNGFTVMLVVILMAVLGTFTYGLVKDHLPH